MVTSSKCDLLVSELKQVQSGVSVHGRIIEMSQVKTSKNNEELK